MVDLRSWREFCGLKEYTAFLNIIGFPDARILVLNSSASEEGKCLAGHWRRGESLLLM